MLKKLEFERYYCDYEGCDMWSDIKLNIYEDKEYCAYHYGEIKTSICNHKFEYYKSYGMYYYIAEKCVICNFWKEHQLSDETAEKIKEKFSEILKEYVMRLKEGKK